MATTEFKQGTKALRTTLLGDGSLIIEGMAAVFNSVDRESESFAPGSFTKSIAKGPVPLCWHHRKTVVLGKVLNLEERPDGLWMRARVDAAIKGDPERRVIFEQIKAGTLSQLSVGGRFRRSGNSIIEADVVEVSVTAAPVDAATWFLVTEGKAVKDALSAVETRNRNDLALLAMDARLARLDATLSRLQHAAV